MDRGEWEPPAPTTPPMPPMPAESPDAGRVPLVDWLRAPRPESAPLGVWKANYEPRPEEEPVRIPTTQLAVGAGLSAVAAWVLGALLWNGYLGTYWLWPVLALTPDELQSGVPFVIISYLYYAIALAVLLGFFGRIGNWGECIRRIRAWTNTQRQASETLRPRVHVPAPEDDPASWRDLRRDGAVQEADQLTTELRSGAVTDVDHVRIVYAWRQARSDLARRAAVAAEIQRRGAGACVHGSGARELPARTGRHDLTVRQVRLGTAADVPRNPYPYRTAGVALDPGLLSTGLLVVGPTGSGKTARVVRPIIESLCLQALTRQAAVVVVTDRGDQCAPASWFDVVIDATAGPSGGRAGMLDLFGGRTDADEAGALAAEALVGDLSGSLPGGELRAAATVVAQLIGPYSAEYGRWPGVGDLRDLLEGAGHFEELWAVLEEKGKAAELRELAAVRRQIAAGGGVVALLADRLTVLDRPALAGIVTPEAGGTALDRLDLPVRVRVDLPEGVHAQAGRVLTRLIIAKFAADTARRRTGAPWPCLVLDDATGAITPQSLESLQRARSAGCGVVVTLRALSDVPEPLRQPLVSVAGCRIVCAGIAPWDAAHFAEAWGTEVVDEVTTTDRQIHADEPTQKMMYGLRRLATGKHVTVQAVSTRRERRQRWPADDLATEVPGGHAVVSVTAPDGQRSSPILIRLGG